MASRQKWVKSTVRVYSALAPTQATCWFTSEKIADCSGLIG